MSVIEERQHSPSHFIIPNVKVLRMDHHHPSSYPVAMDSTFSDETKMESNRGDSSPCICGKPSFAGFRNGTLSEARFSDIQGLVMLPKDDTLGDSSFLLSEQHQIRLVNMKEKVVTTFFSAQLQNPKGMALYKSFLLVCDSQQHKIKMISLDGRRISNFAGTGTRGCSTGRVTDVMFDSPTGICVIGENVFVTDTGNHRVVRISNGFVTNAAGTPKTAGFMDGKVQNSILNNPTDIFAHENTLYINDFGNSRIRQIFANFSVVRTVVESSEKLYSAAMNSEGEMILATHTTVYKYNHETKESSQVLGETAEPIRKLLCTSRTLYLVACWNSVFKIEDRITNHNNSNSSVLDLRQFSRKLGSSQNFSMNSTIQESWKGDNPIRPSYFELIYCYEQDLLEIYNYYCTNTTHTFSDVNEMTSNQFAKFTKDCKVTDKSFHSNDVFLVFEEATKFSPTFKMNFDDFLNALAFMSAKKYSKLPVFTIADLSKFDEDVKVLLRKLLFELVLPNSGKHSIDPTPSELTDPSVASLWATHQDSIYKIFTYYTQKKRTHKDTMQWVSYNKGLITLNVEEFFMFCTDFDIFPQWFSKIQLAKMFDSCCKINQSLSDPSDHVSKEGRLMNFVEFLDCLGRIALAKFSDPSVNEIYKTARQKIEGLLEHMSLSEGRKFFATRLGNRLLTNVESPMKKQLVQQMKQAYLGRNPQRSKLQYTDYSFAKQKQKERDSLDISIKRMAEEQEHRDVKCVSKDVVLYVASKTEEDTSWKYITTGTLTLSLKNKLVLEDLEGRKVFDIPLLSLTALPVVEEKDLFHIFKPGVLFSDAGVYGIQFPSRITFSQFEKEYQGLPNKVVTSSSILITNNTTQNSPRSTPKKHDSPTPKTTPKTTPKVSWSNDSKKNVTTTPKRVDKINTSSFLDDSSIEQPEVSPIYFHPAKHSNSQRKERSSPFVNLESAAADSAKKEDSDDQFPATIPKIIKENETFVTDIVSNYLKENLKYFLSENSALSPKKNVNEKVDNFIKSVTDRIRWSSGFSLTGNLGKILNNNSTSSNATEEDIFDTKERSLAPLILLDSYVCTRLETLDRFYEVMSSQVNTSSQYLEIYVKDDIGVSTFNLKQQWFCVGQGTSYRIEIFTFENEFCEMYLNGEPVTPIAASSTWIILPITIPNRENLESDLNIEQLKNLNVHSVHPVKIELVHKNGFAVRFLLEFALFPSQKELNYSYGVLKESLLEQFKSLPPCFQSLAMFSHRTVKPLGN